MEAPGGNTTDLRKLIGRKIQINYISPASEETTAAGRLLDVTNETIVIDGAIMKTVLTRRHMKIVSVDYVEEHDTAPMVKLVIKGKENLTLQDWKLIGEMICKGITSSKTKPKGIDWELITWGVMR